MQSQKFCPQNPLNKKSEQNFLKIKDTVDVKGNTNVLKYGENKN